MSFSRICFVLILLCWANVLLIGQTKIFDYSRYLFGTPSSLSLNVQSVNAAAGTVTINGVDSRAPTTPFTWYWGDGNVTTGFFPQSHSFANATRNYLLKVIANYSNGTTDSSTILIRLVPPIIVPITLSPDIAVTVPISPVALGSRLYTPPSVTTFGDSFFTTVPRPTLEYVLSVVSSIEKDFMNDNVFLYNSKFQQVMMRDSAFGGAYSLWYTNPVAFGVGDVFMKGSFGYSALIHEMSHNYTLNSPAAYYYGGRIDGNANAIYSETIGAIVQHAAGYEIINNYQHYGLGEDLMTDIQSSFVSSINIVRASFDNYVSAGKKFVCWNDPNTTVDETFNTFMTFACRFCQHAESAGLGYRTPVKRMMKLLQGLNQNWVQQYDRLNNSAVADTFRSTLMVAAISYAFSTDLRAEFRGLNFPVSDQKYNDITNSVTSVSQENQSTPSSFELANNFPNPFNPSTMLRFGLPARSSVRLTIYNTLGQLVSTLADREYKPGWHQARWDAMVPSGVYFCRLEAVSVNDQTKRFEKTTKMVLLR
jgi:hypothetical protein